MWIAGAARAAEPPGIYLVENVTGAIHLTDRPADHAGSRSLMIAGVPTPQPSPAASALHPGRYPDRARRFARQSDRVADIVRSAAQSQGLDPSLLHAVIGVESGYASRAVSPRGAQGLMQLMPGTAREYGVTDAFDPGQNVLAGARHLRALLDQFGQDTTLALAAYNAGASSVWRHGRQVPPYAETISYVPRVLGQAAALRLQLADAQRSGSFMQPRAAPQ